MEPSPLFEMMRFTIEAISLAIPVAIFIIVMSVIYRVCAKVVPKSRR